MILFAAFAGNLLGQILLISAQFDEKSLNGGREIVASLLRRNIAIDRGIAGA
jgi:hypothetical protein